MHLLIDVIHTTTSCFYEVKNKSIPKKWRIKGRKRETFDHRPTTISKMKSSSKSHLKHSSESSYACDPLCGSRLTFTHEKLHALVDTESKIAAAVYIPLRAVYIQQWSLAKKTDGLLWLFRLMGLNRQQWRTRMGSTHAKWSEVACAEFLSYRDLPVFKCPIREAALSRRLHVMHIIVGVIGVG